RISGPCPTSPPPAEGAPLTVIKRYIEHQQRPDKSGPLRGPKNGIGLLPAANGRAPAEEGQVNRVYVF
ncbi:MAG: hypothetical protein QOJ20_2488, partial [Mycobacterium sp.]|nr:hypothetical protein [Mycobacterium sp.]